MTGSTTLHDTIAMTEQLSFHMPGSHTMSRTESPDGVNMLACQNGRNQYIGTKRQPHIMPIYVPILAKTLFKN